MIAIVLTLISTLLLAVSPASAAKQVVDYFGTESGSGSQGGEFRTPAGIAVNQTGAGPASRGDVYVVDGTFDGTSINPTNRIQRFGRDDNGTPAIPGDDSYFFISAWGAGVLSGGAEYEVCAVASSCRAGVSSGGNGTLAGNGSLATESVFTPGDLVSVSLGARPVGVAVDQDTGNVYVSDAANARINVYAGDGVFLRSFGYDVVDSGPGQTFGPDEEQRLTVMASGGRFSLSFRGRTTGALGTGTRKKGSKTVTDLDVADGAFAVGQSISGWNIPVGTTITKVGNGELTLSQASTNSIFGNGASAALSAHDLPANASAAQVQSALNGLPSIGGMGGTVTVTGGPGDPTGSAPYTVHFGGNLAGEDLPPLKGGSGGLTGGSWTVALSGVTGGTFKLRVGQAELNQTGPIAFDASAASVKAALEAVPVVGAGNVSVGGSVGGPWVIQLSPSAVGSGDLQQELNGLSSGLTGLEPRVSIAEPAHVSGLVAGGSYEVCVAAAGDVCKSGSTGSGLGEIGYSGIQTALDVEVSPPDGNPATGTVFVADAGNLRINTYDLDGSSPSSIGSGVVFASGTSGRAEPRRLAVDSRGILYASNRDGIVERYDTKGANGAGVGFLAPISGVGAEGLAVDLDSDGAGSDSDVLYVLRGGNSGMFQFGPANPPGLVDAPAIADEVHGTSPTIGGSGVSLDESDGRLYVTSIGVGSGPEAVNNHGVYILDEPTGPASASLDSIDGITATAATVHATINPNGPPATRYSLEYSADGVKWTSTPATVLGVQETPQILSIALDPPGGGLEPSTLYHVRLVVAKSFKPLIVTPELTFTTLSAPPLVETVGAPVRTATTAHLGGRVSPRNSSTTFSFEYGSEGPCDANPCQATPSQSAGSGAFSQLVSTQVEELEPNTTYHYRVVADNGNPGSPVAGEDMTVTTLASDAPLSHGHFPGPPGSDRAWEQISAPDTGGNPVLFGALISDDGNRSVYGVTGGTPSSETGAFNQFFAERTPSGWQTRDNYPVRSQIPSPSWSVPAGRSDLSRFFTVNWGFGSSAAIFGISPFDPPTKLYEIPATSLSFFSASDNGSRVVAGLKDAHDPSFPAVSGTQLYDISSGIPSLVSLLPGGTPPVCGISKTIEFDQLGVARTIHWLSSDGGILFFASQGSDCAGAKQIYLRDLVAEESVLVSKPPVSGPNCGGHFIKSAPGMAFFWTQSRLVAEDAAPSDCSDFSKDGDVYRYLAADDDLECVTCVVPGASADIAIGTSNDQTAYNRIAVSEDGSRVYFLASTRLLPGAQAPGLYRVEVGTGNLAYVGQVEPFDADEGGKGNALNPDGSVLVFRADDPGLNPIGGANNGGSAQFYRYDDRDRSLVCLSCPLDGSTPRGEVTNFFSIATGPNQTPLSADGNTYAFTTPTALVGSDQNTAGPGQDADRGTDVYEWRDGRLLLVTDGLTNWAGSLSTPQINGITPSGRDIVFSAAAQYTPDALDDYQRLYVAKVGGGIEFPAEQPPCPLEVCQGTPKGAPEEAVPGTGTFSGPGDSRSVPVKARCPKGKRKVRRAGKARCVKREKRRSGRAQRANHDGRGTR